MPLLQSASQHRTRAWAMKTGCPSAHLFVCLFVWFETRAPASGPPVGEISATVGIGLKPEGSP